MSESQNFLPFAKGRNLFRSSGLRLTYVKKFGRNLFGARTSLLYTVRLAYQKTPDRQECRHCTTVIRLWHTNSRPRAQSRYMGVTFWMSAHIVYILLLIEEPFPRCLLIFTHNYNNQQQLWATAILMTSERNLLTFVFL